MSEDRKNSEMMRDLTVHWTRAQPNVSAFISSMVINFHDAEDLIQQVAQSIAEEYHRYDSKQPFIGWALGIARFKVYNYYRSSKKRQLLDAESLDKIEAAYTVLEPEMDELREALDHCMKQVKGRAGDAIRLRYLNDFKPKQIGEKIGMSANAVSVMLFRVRETLSRCLQLRTGLSEVVDE